MTEIRSFPEYYTNDTSLFRDVTKVYILARADKDALAGLVAEPLNAPFNDDRVLITWTRVGSADNSNDIHYFDFRVPMTFGALSAVHCGLEYIDDDRGLVIGREMWGYPKRGAQFTWSETETSIESVATREGHTIGTLSFTADSSAP